MVRHRAYVLLFWLLGLGSFGWSWESLVANPTDSSASVGRSGSVRTTSGSNRAAIRQGARTGSRSDFGQEEKRDGSQGPPSGANAKRRSASPEPHSGQRCLAPRTSRPGWAARIGQVVLWPVATAMRLLWTPAALVVSWADQSGFGAWVRRNLDGRGGRFIPFLHWENHRRPRAGGMVLLPRMQPCDRCRLLVTGWGGGRRVFGGRALFGVDLGKKVLVTVASGADERDDLRFHAAPWAVTGPYGLQIGFRDGVMLWRRRYEVAGAASWRRGPWMVAGGVGWQDLSWGGADGLPSHPIPVVVGSDGLSDGRQAAGNPWPWPHASGMLLRAGVGYQSRIDSSRHRSGAVIRPWSEVRAADRRQAGLGLRADLWWFAPGRPASTIRATADLWYGLPIGARALVTAWVELAYQPSLTSKRDRRAGRSLAPAEWPSAGGQRLLRGWREGASSGPFLGFASLEYRQALPFGFDALAFFDWAQTAGQDLEGWSWSQGLWSLGARLEWGRLGPWAPYVQFGLGRRSWLCAVGMGMLR